MITRGVGARAAAPVAPQLRGRALRELPRRAPSACGRSRQSGLHPSNCRLLDAGEAALTMAGDGSPRAARARLRVDRPSGRRARWRGRSSCAPSTAARSAEAARAHGAERRRRLAGARRSSARPTCATCSSRWACSPRRSRRRSPGSASRRFHERVIAAAERGACARSCGGERQRASAASRTSTRTGRRPTSPCSRPRARGEEVEQWAAIKRAVVRGDHRRGRHDHPPPRRRARPPPLV